MLNSPRVLPPQMFGALQALRSYLEPSAGAAATIPALRARAHVTEAVIRLENLVGTGPEHAADVIDAIAPADASHAKKQNDAAALLTRAVEQLSEAVAAAVHASDILELAHARRAVQEALALSGLPQR